MHDQIIVVGAGVIGLTTALKIQESDKYKVTIIADVIPSDPKSIRYTSNWAGAHHVYNSIDDSPLHEYEKRTFKVMWDLSAPGSEAEESFLRIPQTEYYINDAPNPNPFEEMPNFRYLTPDEIAQSTVPEAKSGCTFNTISIDVPIYLNYLLTRFLARGGRIFRASVQHISQIIEGGASLSAPDVQSEGQPVDPFIPAAVVVACGIGARFLGGVEDKDVYPIRGQTVLVRAPWIRFGRTSNGGPEVGSCTYIIPRRSSDVIVGGTRVENDWFPKPRPEVTKDILARGVALCPELAPPEVRAERTPTVDDVLPHVVGLGCGLRPGRKGGVRLEVEWTEGIGGRGKVPVIHNYGHAGYGYQASWGCADKVLGLLNEALANA